MGIQVFPAAEVGGGGLDFELISSINMGTGSPVSISFSTIDPKYKTLKLIIAQTTSNTNRIIQVGINGSTASVYGYSIRRLAAGTWTSSEVAADSALSLNIGQVVGSTVMSDEVYFFDTNLATPTNVIFNGVAAGTITGWGCFNDPAVVTSIEVKNNGVQTFSSGTAYLLGSES